MNIKHTILSVAFMLGMGATSVAQINLGNLIENAGKIVQDVTATDNFEAKDLVGTWNYVSPGVNFKGDNALTNIGGSAAASTLENKLVPYYNRLGINKMVMTVNQDLTFTIQIAKVKLSGTISKDEATKQLVFNFSAYQKMSLGKVNCIAKKSGSALIVTFDATKIMNIAKKISSLSSNASFKSINALLSNYDGLYIGARLKQAK